MRWRKWRSAYSQQISAPKRKLRSTVNAAPAFAPFQARLPDRLGTGGVPALWATPALAGVTRSGERLPRNGAVTASVTLPWYDLTSQTVAAAAFPEAITQSRTWPVGWLAAARAVGLRGDPGYATAAFAQALHDTLAAQVPRQQPQLDATLAATLAGVPGGGRARRAPRRWHRHSLP